MARPCRGRATLSCSSSADSSGGSRPRAPSIAVCWRPRLQRGACSSSASCSRRPARSRSLPTSVQNFFPPVENTQIKLHVRAPTGTRIENTAIICDRVERAIRSIIPPDALEPMSITSDCRSAASIRPTTTPAPSAPRTRISSSPSSRNMRPGRTATSSGCARPCRDPFPGRRSPSCLRTSSRKFSISAFPRRSTFRSSVRISPPTTSTPTNC